jgi:hypothetical protein
MSRINWAAKILLYVLDALLLKRYGELSVGLLKIQAATCYVKGVIGARRLFVSAVLLSCLLLLLAVGFVLVHVGFFIWVPWSANTKALVLLALGVVYMTVSSVLILRRCSEKTWMKLSKADSVLAAALNRR